MNCRNFKFLTTFWRARHYYVRNNERNDLPVCVQNCIKTDMYRMRYFSLSIFQIKWSCSYIFIKVCIENSRFFPGQIVEILDVFLQSTGEVSAFPLKDCRKLRFFFLVCDWRHSWFFCIWLTNFTFFFPWSIEVK